MKIEDADALLERGWYLFDEEKYDLAIKIYNRVLELDPRNVLALSDI
jgi:tetratricopeptide (TPR) repeat protein